MMRLPFSRRCSVTQSLFAIKQDVIRLPFRESVMLLTHFLLVIVAIRLPVRKMCNVTHRLYVIGQDVMRMPFQTNVQYHSHTVHRARCDETALQKHVQCH